MASEQDQDPAGKSAPDKSVPAQLPVWRRVRWWAVALVMLVTSGVFAGIYYLPVLARPVVLSVAADLGISDLDLKVTEIGWRRAKLSGVSVGQSGGADPDLSINDIALTYTPADLLAGRVGTITLSDVVLRVQLGDGRLEFGALDPVIARLRGDAGTQADTASSPAPFDTIVLERAQLLASTPEGMLVLAFEGIVDTALDDAALSTTFNVVLEGDMATGRAAVSAEFGGAEQMVQISDLALRSDHELLPGLVAVEGAQADVQIDGTGHIDATFTGKMELVAASDRAIPVKDARVAVDLTAVFDPVSGAGTIAMTECASVVARAVDEAFWSADEIRLCPDDRVPLIQVDVGEGAVSLQSSFAVLPARVSVGDVLVGTTPRVNATIRRGADGQIVVRSSLAGGDMQLPQQALRLSDVAASVSLAPGAAGQLGKIEIDTLQVTDTQTAKRFASVLASFSLSLDGLGENGILNSRVKGPVSVQTLTGERLLQGTVTHELGSGKGQLSFNSDGLTFSENALQPQDLAPVLRGVVAAVSGDVSAEGRITWDRSGIKESSAKVALTDLGLQASAARFSGVSGEIEFSSLVPFRTRGTQAVSIGVVDAGMPLAGGVALVRVEGGGDVIIENAQWPFAGGQLVLTSGALNTRADVQRAELAALSINLSELLTLVEMEGLSGEGVLGGAVPIEIRDGSVYVVEAKLEAEPGGIIRYSNASTDAAGQTAEGANIAFQALENFHFDVLSVEIDGPVDGDITLKIVLRGANPELLEGYPVHLNISTQGAFLELLRRGTVGLRALDVVTGKENLEGLDVERVGPEP